MSLRVVLLVVVAACHAGKARTGTDGPAKPADASEAKEIDVAAAEELIRKELAGPMHAKPAELEVRVMADADVPGVVVWNVRLPPEEKGDPSEYAYGVVANGRVVTDTAEAMSIIAKAWGYGQKRTVPPEKVAKVFGMLEGTSEETATAIIEQRTIDRLREKDKLFLPKETTVNGLPAVEYWVRSAGDPGLWRTEVTFHPDGRVTLKVLEKAD